MIRRDEQGNVTAIICSRPKKQKCAYCDELSTKLCDHPKDGGGTCDAPMCWRHAWQPPGDLDHDYCRIHRRKMEGPEREAQRKAELEAKKRDTLIFISDSKYAGQCREKDCGALWKAGEPCYWDVRTKEVFCVECGDLMNPGE